MAHRDAPASTGTPGSPTSRASPPTSCSSRYENVKRHADGRNVTLNCCLSVEVTDGPVEQEPDRLRGTPEQLASALERFEEIGVGHVALQFLVGRYPERLAQMERLMPVIAQMSRTVVVTGGAKGIGRAITEKFADLGDDVIALGRDEAALKQLSNVRTAICDVTDEDAVTRHVRRAR